MLNEHEQLKEKILHDINPGDLDLLIKELEFLCYNLDPYQSPNSRELELLKKLEIQNINDPFKLTNTLVYLTEEAITLKQKIQ